MRCWSRTELLELYWQLPDKERDRQFWTTQQVAALLRLSDARIRQLIDEDRMPAIKIFGRLQIHIPTLKAMLSDSQEN